MITILATVILSQFTTTPPAMGLFEVRNMIERTAGQRDSWDYTNNIRGFRSMAPQAKAKGKSQRQEAGLLRFPFTAG